jgi:protein-tyrosine kinase
MSVEPATELLPAGDSELNDALIAHCGLSPQNVARILELARASQISFCDAALQLNLASRSDIEQVLSWVRERGGDVKVGVLETAIRNARKATTALTLRQGVGRPGSQLLHARDSEHPRNEKVRALRTDLMLLSESSQRGNVFALVSPGRGEGRSQLCAELAIAFAQLGRRTLLVDADLRHPCQHVLFSTDNQLGLAQTLGLGHQPYLNGIDGIPELALLTSGAVPPNPLELVSNRRFDSLMTELRRQYEFVVIDTPAVSKYADALQIASVAERVLVLSRTESTSFRAMKDMLRRLAITESRIVGAIISKF